MEDIDKLQSTFENIDRLIEALVPFASSDRRGMLLSFHKMLEPMKHLKDIFQTMEMVKAMQAAMSDNPDGSPDLNALSKFLSPEQAQMLEMFQSMQDINL